MSNAYPLVAEPEWRLLADIKKEAHTSLTENCGYHNYNKTPQESQPTIFSLPSSQILERPGPSTHYMVSELLAKDNDFFDKAQERNVSLQNKRRNPGGRKPIKSSNPEEEEKLAIRRERNKLAAARCRKRRVDHTNQLTEETEKLQKEGIKFKKNIDQLQYCIRRMEYNLRDHEPCTNDSIRGLENGSKNSRYAMKNYIMDYQWPASIQNNEHPRERPTSLPVMSNFDISQHLSIKTPTQGMGFNFDSLMEGGTGLTPVSAALAPTYHHL